MNETLYLLIGYGLGITIGYIIWAPDTTFKRNFIDGLTLKFIWGKK